MPSAPVRLFTLSAIIALGCTTASAQPATKPSMAKICTTCHTPEPSTLFGNWDSLVFQNGSFQMKLDEFSRKRWAAQPAAPSAGCIFKNPAAIPAGKLIDELGLKDTRVGGARVSLEHGNFIVNDGNATAEDVMQLIERIRTLARVQRGIELETEVEIVGE